MGTASSDGDGDQRAPKWLHLPAPAGSSSGAGGKAHTFASYLDLRKQGNCQVIMHRTLLKQVRCVCSKWRNKKSVKSAVPKINAGEDTASSPDAEQAMEDGVPLGNLVFEGCSCLKCAEEICEKTNYLTDLAPIGNGRDKPLHHVAITNNLTMFCHLITLVGEKLDHQAAVQALNKINNRAETPLYVAIIAGCKDMVELMLWVDPQLSGIACHEVSPIYLAVSLGRKEIAEMLHVALGEDAGQSCYSGPNGQNVLHAAMQASEDMIPIVLAWKMAKVLTEQKDENGNTPLHFAASVEYTRPWWAGYCSGFFPVFFQERLLELFWGVWSVPPCWHILNTNPSMAKEPNNEGLFPLHIAAMTNHWILVHTMLRDCIGCKFLIDGQGRTFLHVAVQNNGFDIVINVYGRWEFDSIMNIQDINGNTALHLAVDLQNLGMVCALLMNRHVSLNIRNDKGETALDLARSRIRAGYYFSGNPDKIIYNMLERVGAKHGSHRWDHIQQHCITQQKQKQDKAEEKKAEELKKKAEDQEKEESKNLTSATGTLGIGAVLITTVTFGATFALPGGYKADDHVNGGTPTLAGPWYFDAFMVANTLAFILSSVATMGLMYSGMALVSLQYRRIHFSIAVLSATSSITSLAAAFALGVYMVLAPVARSTAIAICAVSPLVLLYRNVQGLSNIYIVFVTIGARRGLLPAVRYAAKVLLFRALSELWPLAVIVGWAGHLRDQRHG